MPNEFIELTRVATNNLKEIDVCFPLGEYTVVTGVSGSGKSSLVFDTLYGESYRRYVESLSSFARQYLKALPKPKIEDVKNLPPAIAVQQSRQGVGNRSTVGTLTELIDILRILFAHVAQIVCPGCQATITKDSEESIGRKLLATYAGETIAVAAPLTHWQKMTAKDLKKQLTIQGFVRLATGSGIKKINDVSAAELKEAAVLIDRITVSGDDAARLMEAVKLALKVGRGQLKIFAGEETKPTIYTTELYCPDCERAFQELTSPTMLNFNHPLGACPQCQGFGREGVIDRAKVIPDQTASLATKGVAPWNFGKHAAYYRWVKKSADDLGIDFGKPFAKYTAEEWDWLYAGADKGYHGIEGYFAWLDRKKYKPHYRIHAARFRKYVTCHVCEGDRLKADVLVYQILGQNIVAVSRLSVKELSAWFTKLDASLKNRGLVEKDAEGVAMGFKEAMEEGLARTGYLLKMGLSYLSLNRSARTLSGGELQRINMARSLGSSLTGTLFCLDEPSAGLHARDSGNLLEVIRELKDQGNTVVVVEHDETLAKNADHLIEIGPGAGHRGGNLVYKGEPKSLRDPGLVWNLGDPVPASFKNFIVLKGAETHNLKNIDVRFPVGHLTVVCGVSGSGKTSLIQRTLYPLLLQTFGEDASQLNEGTKARSLSPVELIKKHREAILVSQEGIGRSTRSNIATYLGIMNDVRNLLASLPAAKARKLTPSHFSFNVSGGRCETCRGLGTVVEDLSFLGEMAVICPVCDGRRFSEAVLEVVYRGKSLIDILNLTVAEALELFFDQKGMAATLDSVVRLGLGYVTLGQHTSSFSGGEAQRLKLLNLLKETKAAKPCILIFDEPSTGLSDRDVHVLMQQLKELTAKGHTVIVVEHHLGVIRAADWIVEIGPEAADQGGKLVFEGPASSLRGTDASITAKYV